MALAEEDDVTIDVVDRLPTPFGLVRYGVAPDHEKMKSVANTLRKVFLQDNVRFLGNVEFGRDISMDDLRARYGAVIIASGAATDRRLEIQGEDLDGSFSATEFVSWYSGHPDAAVDRFTLNSEAVIVIGAGNVAVDVARMMSKKASQLRVTDIPDHVLRVLSDSQIRDVVIVARRGPAQAKFTTKELRELGELDDVDVIVHPDDLVLDATSEAMLEDSPVARRNLEVLRGWSQREGRGCSRRLHLRFLLRPLSILGENAVSGAAFVRCRLDDAGHAIDTDEVVRVSAQMVLRSVGYRGGSVPDMPFDETLGVIPNMDGRILRSGRTALGEYVTGWIKRGPTGIIGTNKVDANETVRCLLEDADVLRASQPRDASDILELLAQRGVEVVDWHGFEAIEALETASGRMRDAERVKVVDLELMLAAARSART